MSDDGWVDGDDVFVVMMTAIILTVFLGMGMMPFAMWNVVDDEGISVSESNMEEVDFVTDYSTLTSEEKELFRAGVSSEEDITPADSVWIEDSQLTSNHLI